MERHRKLIGGGAICGSEKALAQARDLQPRVILVGLDMPGMEIIPRLRDLLPGVSLIALTLLNCHAYRQAAIVAGMDDLVPKAKLNIDLLLAIRRMTRANRSR